MVEPAGHYNQPMRFSALLVASSLLLASCASSGSSASDGTTASNAAIPEPEMTVAQLVGPDEQNWPQGEIEIQYAVRIENRADQPITLKQIAMKQLGNEGAYTVYDRRYPMTRVIPAHATEDVTFWAKAYSSGRRFGLSARSPISVRTTAFFESAAGPLRKVVVTNLSQATMH
jgi:hypothetical protein